jgi:hypothetical protein
VSLTEVTPSVLLEVALAEARVGLGEGGIPIRTALFGVDGRLLGRGHNRRVQDDDPSMHAETTAFRAVGRQRDYRDTIMVTTCRRAGIAAGWSASSVSARSWSARRAPGRTPCWTMRMLLSPTSSRVGR